MCRCLKVTDAVLTGVNLCFVLCLYILLSVCCSKKYRTVMSWFNFWFVFHFSIFFSTPNVRTISFSCLLTCA